VSCGSSFSSSGLDAEVELQMTRTQPQITEQWKHRQLALAEYLDTFSELASQLDSLREFAQFCAEQEVSSSHDFLPDKKAKPGLYLLSNHHASSE